MERISVNEIEKLFALIINKLKADDANNFELDLNEYWIVLADQWNNFNGNPQLAIGSLKDDVLYLKRAIEEDEIISYSEFDRLATVLRAISEKEAPTT